MISTPMLLLSGCVLAAAVAQPFGFAWNQPAFGFQPGFPQFGNFGNFGLPGWLPQPKNTGPWVSTEDGNYKIVAKAENYAVSDLKVKIKDGSVGLKGDVMGSNSRSFSFSYTIPENGNANQATAVLTSNGYLIVTIPLTGSVGDIERDVPITASSETYTRSD